MTPRKTWKWDRAFAQDSRDLRRQLRLRWTEKPRQSPASRCVEQRTGSYLQMTWPMTWPGKSMEHHGTQVTAACTHTDFADTEL